MLKGFLCLDRNYFQGSSCSRDRQPPREAPADPGQGVLVAFQQVKGVKP